MADKPSTMKANHRSWFAPLQKAARAFFSHDLALRRADGRVQLVLEGRPSGGVQSSGTRAEQSASREARDLSLARAELARLLDDDPGLRSTLRHLAFVEHALEKKGWRSLYKVPPDVLKQALAQLEDLVTNWSAEGLACLRSKMAVAVIDREDEVPAPGSDVRIASLVQENPAELAGQVIDEARVSSEDDDAALLAAYGALVDSAFGDSRATGEAETKADAPEPKAATQITVRGDLGAPTTIHLRDLR
jgi:hypothetical protein